MAVTSNRTTSISFSGDILYAETFTATPNNQAAGVVNTVDLLPGINTILTPPLSGGAVRTTALTIVPPPTNTTIITLRGLPSDVGIPLHPTEPCTITFNTGGSIVLQVNINPIYGLRIIWS